MFDKIATLKPFDVLKQNMRILKCKYWLTSFFVVFHKILRSVDIVNLYLYTLAIFRRHVKLESILKIGLKSLVT